MEKRIDVVKFLDLKNVTEEEFNGFTDELNLVEENSFFNHAFDASSLKYEFIENPFSIVYFYYLDNKLVGYLDFWITFDSATIFRIAVDSSYQKLGIASELMAKMIKEINEFPEEISMTTLEVRVNNIKAIKLYEKFDFKQISIKKGYYDDGEDAIFMGRGM